MNSRILKAATLAGAAVLLFAIGFVGRKANDAPPVVAKPNEVPTTQVAPPPSVTERTESKGVIEDILDRLQKRTLTPAELLAFRQALLNGDPAAVIPTIRAFLATGNDVSTGFGFELGENGVLDRAPTLRLLLLDVLGQLSRKAQTADASDVSRQILADKKSPDEWAIALRNVAWSEPQSRAFLASKFAEMVNYEFWRTQPTNGFLEAFDVAVFSRQVSVMNPLGEALDDPIPDLQRAAAVALDRLAESAPLEVMQKLNSQPQMFADHPFLRADWFAKADLSEPAQRAAFESYLARPDVTFAEKEKALKALASPGQFISENLITTAPAPADEAAREAAILAAAKDWGQKFPNLAMPLMTLRERLGP